MFLGSHDMSENRRSLPTKLANARQQLEQARAHVAELEAQLFGDQPELLTSITSEDHFHRTLDNMLEGCQIIGFDWRYLYVNDTVARHGLREKEELLGHTMMECYPGIDETEMFALLQRCMQERAVDLMENAFTYPDGSTAWFELRIQPVPEGIFVLSLDITARKQAEAAIKRYAQRMELLHEIDRGIIEAQSTAAILTFTLKRLQELIPCQRAELVVFDQEKNDAQVFAAEINDLPDVSAGLRRPIAPADWIASFGPDRIKVIGDLREPPEIIPIYEQPLKDGMRSILHILLTHEAQPIGVFDLLSDTPNFFIDAYQEIAAEIASQLAIAIHQRHLSEALERHAAQLEQKVLERTAELQAAKERVEAILNSSPDGILLAHADLTIQQTNAAFDRLFACEPDAYFDQPLTTLLHADDGDLLSQVLPADGAEEQVANMEVRARRHDGTTFDAELSIGFINAHGWVCIIRDITKRKQAEAALRQAFAKEKELSELKSRFVSMASHEFRTPLAGILSTSELLKGYWRRLDQQRIDEKLEVIHQQVDRMVQMIDDMLILGRAESGRLAFRPETLDLSVLCQALCDEFRQSIAANHQLVFSEQGGCHSINADPKLLRHTLSNLVSNAAKYSANGSSIQVNLECNEQETRLQVIDQGIGIPQQDQQRLFETFHRAGNVGQVPGTGLGLAITKQAVELHNGAITFESEAGSGTTFTIVIPR
jgi:PAS domain S-box-containing protein